MLHIFSVCACAVCFFLRFFVLSLISSQLCWVQRLIAAVNPTHTLLKSNCSFSIVIVGVAIRWTVSVPCMQCFRCCCWIKIWLFDRNFHWKIYKIIVSIWRWFVGVGYRGGEKHLTHRVCLPIKLSRSIFKTVPRTKWIYDTRKKKKK